MEFQVKVSLALSTSTSEPYSDVLNALLKQALSPHVARPVQQRDHHTGVATCERNLLCFPKELHTAFRPFAVSYSDFSNIGNLLHVGSYPDSYIACGYT